MSESDGKLKCTGQDNPISADPDIVGHGVSHIVRTVIVI